MIRGWDMEIFKMATFRHLGFVLWRHPFLPRDFINCDKFWDNGLRGFDFYRRSDSNFPHGNL